MRFLQWALPRLGFRWRGFRKVRRQVCRRVYQRVRELHLSDLDAYRDWIDRHPEEWDRLDSFCRISISKFYRDHDVYAHLAKVILPDLARRARITGGEERVEIWCAGCASGEEPYTLRILWEFGTEDALPRPPLRILATDIDEHLLDRARVAEYSASSLRELPEKWRSHAFDRMDDHYRLKPAFREDVEFSRQDIRRELPEGRFHLILCRNLVCTYFEEQLQRDTLRRVVERLLPGGWLVLGRKESIPSHLDLLEVSPGPPGVYQPDP